jgi:hypothetical protein
VGEEVISVTYGPVLENLLYPDIMFFPFNEGSMEVDSDPYIQDKSGVNVIKHIQKTFEDTIIHNDSEGKTSIFRCQVARRGGNNGCPCGVDRGLRSGRRIFEGLFSPFMIE